MSFCSNCGKEIPEGYVCPSCNQVSTQAPPSVPQMGQQPRYPQMMPPQKKGGGGTALVVIGIGCVVLFVGIIVIGILAAIAIPNFLKFQSLAKQSEAKVQLKMLQQEQMYFNVDTGRFANSFRDLNWTPPVNNQYGYCLPDEQVESSVHGYIELPVEASPFVTDYNFVMTAVGNIDNDPFLDIWQVDMNGELYHLFDDNMDIINIQGD